jgi:small-conductance mechanosensitive channel
MENKNDVKGGLVIEQMKRYARRLSKHTGSSVNLRIEVWHHPARGSVEKHTSVDFILWDSVNSRFIEIPYPDEDLRAVGREIDKRIGYERAAEKRSKFTGHMGE